MERAKVDTDDGHAGLKFVSDIRDRSKRERKERIEFYVLEDGCRVFLFSAVPNS